MSSLSLRVFLFLGVHVSMLLAVVLLARVSPAATPINDAINAASLAIAFVVLTILLLWLLTVSA